MRNFKNILFYTLSLLIVGVSCSSEDELVSKRMVDNPFNPDNPVIVGTSGTADFSKYVSLGNSLTAGYMDGALYTDGQNNSFPNILGNQFRNSGLSSGFNQPDINSENGYNPSFSNLGAGVIAGRTELSIALRAPVPTAGELPTAYEGNTSKLNNFGVPGARVADLLNPFYGTPDLGNPYFTRFNSMPGAKSILEDALATNPTFYTLWIGSNDVLGYALGGGEGDDPLVTYSQASFTADYSSIVGQLAGAGAKGVVINIPPVLLIPYLRAIPFNPIPMDASTATSTNAAFNDPATGYNPGLGAALQLGEIDMDEYNLRLVNWVEGANGFLIEDNELTTADISAAFGYPPGTVVLPNYRQTKASDLVPLSAGAVLGKLADPNNPKSVYGVGVALGDKYALTIAEQTAVVTARATYSAVIAGIAAAIPGVVMLDIQPLFADVAGLTPVQAAQLALTSDAQTAADGVQGIKIGGYNYAPDFSPNGLFSTDGVHPNPKGHAVVTNMIIQAINKEFGATVPEVDLVPYRTVITTTE